MEAAKQLDNLTWADLTIINEELITVLEFEVNSLKYRDLQIVCSQLKIKGVRTPRRSRRSRNWCHYTRSKQSMTKFWRRLILHQQERSHSALTGCWTSFFGCICWRLFSTWDVAAHTELDVGKAANNQLFWQGVQDAFKGQDEANENLHFADDELLIELHYINFNKIVPHDWKKLRAMWKCLNSEYKAELSCFTWSSTHLSNFFEFCNGHHENYYLLKHLESNPDLMATGKLQQTFLNNQLLIKI